MTRSSLRFDAIEIRRAPGFPSSGVSVEGLCRGINIIYGPNASGKTTLARAMMRLLWPNRRYGGDEELRGELWVDDRHWTLVFEGGRVRSFQGGIEAPFVQLPPLEAGDRYCLALHELLQTHTRDQNFAQVVRRETAGGVDLHRASERLGFRKEARRHVPESKRLQQALERTRASQRRQETLLAEEDRYRTLEERRNEAAQARKRSHLLEKAIAYADAFREKQESDERVASFPPVLDELAGNEMEALAGQRQRRQGLASEAAQIQESIHQAEETLQRNEFPQRPPAEHEIEELRQISRSLQEAEKQRDSLEQSKAGAREQAQYHQSLLNTTISVESAEQLPEEAMQELAEIAQQADLIRADETFNSLLHHWLGEEPVEEERETLQQGMRCLDAWLRESRGPRLFLSVWRRALLLVGIFSLGAGGALVSLAHPLGSFLFGTGFVLTLLSIGTAYGSTSPADLRRADYQRLGLPEPQRWHRDAVEGLLADLQRRWARSFLEAERQGHWQRYAAFRQKFEHDREALTSKREAFERQFGARLESAESHLYWLAQQVFAWQKAQSRVMALDGELQQIYARMGEYQRRLDEGLYPFGYGAPIHGEQAAARVGELEQRARQRQEAIERLVESRRYRDRLQEEIRSCDVTIEAVFRKVGLEVGEEGRLNELIRMREAFHEAKDRQKIATYRLQREEQEIRKQSELDETLLQRRREDLVEELSEVRDLAEQYDSLSRELIEIRTRIESAKQGSELEEAMADYQEKREELAARWRQDCAAVTGDLLVDWLESQTRERDRPQVFYRAQELLSAFTGGRHWLELEDKVSDGIELAAVDTTTGIRQGLDTLSSATRVQLLIAVRMAFIEHQEASISLPVILDEALANSDEARAQALIEAAMTISRSGRQVLCLTAQEEEVTKWRSALEKNGGSDALPYRLIRMRSSGGP